MSTNNDLSGGSCCNCVARIRAEHPDMQPSSGYDEVDELLGLLRVARGDAKMYHDEALQLRKELLRITREAYALPPGIHACKNCGRPGASLHFPGGYLCPDGCEGVVLPGEPNTQNETHNETH